MNNLISGAPRYDDMQSFLDFIYELALSNPDVKMSRAIVYRMLDKIGLKELDYSSTNKPKDVKSLFNGWSAAFKTKDQIFAFCDEIKWSYWEQFISSRMPDKPYIKLYVPLDYNHIQDGVIELFNFVEQLNVSHASKVARVIRNDNVVIRLSASNKKEALQIIDFISNNPYIKAGLNRPNPFVPTINGVGWMLDVGESYNGRIADEISSYTNLVISKNKKPNLKEFYDYFVSRLDLNEKEGEYYKYALDNAMGIKKQEKEQKNLSDDQKRSILWDAIKATYDKYGMLQARGALVAIIAKSNYMLITKGDNSINYRKKLMDNVSKEDIVKYIKASAAALGVNSEGLTNIEMLDEVLNRIFVNDETMKFHEACTVTLDNHGPKQLVGAIDSYFTYMDANSFSRYKLDGNNEKNYREEVLKINPDKVIDIMKNYLRFYGIHTENLTGEQVTNVYVDCMIRSKYNGTNISEKNQSSRTA